MASFAPCTRSPEPTPLRAPASRGAGAAGLRKNSNLLLWTLALCLGFGSILRAETEVYTNIYVVPPTFLTASPYSPGWKPAEPPEERYQRREPPTAKAVLENAGVAFPEGGSALFNPTTSQLVVRTTADQMTLVEAYIGSISSPVEPQIYVTIHELKFRGDLSALLKPDEANAESGSSEVDGKIAALFRFPNPPHPKEAGHRLYFDSYDSFRAELTRPPKPMEEERRIRKTGTLTDEEFQVTIERLAQFHESELQSLPSVMARSGQPVITLVEDRRYGIVPVLAPGETGIDLDLFLPEHGKALFQEGETTLKPTIRTRVEDQSHVVVAEKTANGEHRLIFVRAQLMDPAGQPFPKQPETTPQEPE